jgi:hypothetical protein
MYDLRGTHLRELINEIQTSGDYQQSIISSSYNSLCNGIYFIILEAGAQKSTQKLVFFDND